MSARALMALIMVGELATTACTRSNPVSCADGYCQDPALPFCDVDGALEGNVMTCIAVDCTPGAVAGCRADQAIVCNNAGDNYDLSHCDNGCDDATGCIAKSCVPNTVRCGDRVVEQCDANGVLHTAACEQACVSDPAPHCSYISPQYLPNVCDVEATEPAREILGQVTVDTSQAANCNGGMVPQTVGRPICVLRYKEMTVKSGGTLIAVGLNPIAIVTDGSLRVIGLVDASARSRLAGPGALSGNGGQATSIRGGGGAGFATSGAAGGGVSAGTGGSGGISNGQDELFGGNNGSYSGLGDVYVGGGGGGAVALISCRDQVLIDGGVLAGGAGGQGGHVHVPPATASFVVGGGGGGSGGTIVLQGLNVVVSGTLNANGGGGGCGKPSAGAVGVDGSDGKSSIAPPAACTPSSNEGAGGSGGAAALAPQPGGGATVGTPGGGGGSVGFIRTFTPSTVIPSVNPTRVSPAVQPNMNVPVR